jgi:hypothetical protein
MWCISLFCIRVISRDPISHLYWDLNIFLMGVVQIECILVLDRDRGDVGLDRGLMGVQYNCPLMFLIRPVNLLLLLVILGVGYCYACNRIHLDW